MLIFDECRAGAFVSPAGSVGASASQRCPPDTRTVNRPYCVVIIIRSLWEGAVERSETEGFVP